MKTISIKELRSNMALIADEVEKGQTYVVIRRSKPAFQIHPYSTAANDEGDWETVVDFTEGGKSKGANIEDVLIALKRVNKSK